MVSPWENLILSSVEEVRSFVCNLELIYLILQIFRKKNFYKNLFKTVENMSKGWIDFFFLFFLLNHGFENSSDVENYGND